MTMRAFDVMLAKKSGDTWATEALVLPKARLVSVADARGSAVSSEIKDGKIIAKGVKVQVRGEAECGAFTVEVACSAGVYDKGGPILTCSPDTLLMLIKVAGWYAIEHANHSDEDYEALRNRHPARLALSAFTLAAKSDSDASLQTGLDALRAESEAADPPRNLASDRYSRAFLT